MSKVYGGVRDRSTGEIFDWDGVTIEQVLADVRKLTGTKYGKHWDFNDDGKYAWGFNDNAEYAWGDIFVRTDSGDEYDFEGKKAVSGFLKAFGNGEWYPEAS